jgi:phage terminase large subunit-like protein
MSLSYPTTQELRELLPYLTEPERVEMDLLLSTWTAQARPNQLPPDGDWRTWLVLAGRGFGKTRTGAEWVREQIESGKCRRMILVGRTTDDVRDVMIEGESGLLTICPPWNKPTWTPSLRRIQWPSGAFALAFSADKPDILRGKQCDGAWADELAAWRRPETWDQLLMGLRLGNDPRVVVTTTPRPTKIIKALMADASTHLTKGTSYDNRANLAPAFFTAIIKRYEGTRLGRQELNAEVLEDAPGALWKRSNIEALRVGKAPDMTRVVVAIDPSVTTTGDEAGIIVAGKGTDGQGYVLDDLSLQASPHGWGSQAVVAYHRYTADRIVAEVNNGGEMVELTVRTVDPNVSYRAVHASRGKQTRAEPVAALYEQGRVHHVGALPELEDEMCQWETGAASPNRMDALVWALTELMLGNSLEGDLVL